MGRSVKAEEIYTLWEAYDAERASWASEAANDEDFYMGNQYTKEEIAILKERGMAPLVVNRVMPVIQQEMAIFLAKRPTFRYLPQEDDDVEKAKLFSDIASYIWHQSGGDTQLSRAVQDYFVTGAGYVHAYVDPYEDEGRGEVLFKHVPVWDVYPDPNSREIDLSDARYVFISRLIDKETLKFHYPDKEGMINGLETENGPVADRPMSNPHAVNRSTAEIQFASPGSAGKVRTIQSFKKIRKKRIKLFDTLKGTSTIVDPVFLDKDTLPSHMKCMDMWETYIKVMITAGRTTILDEHELAIPHYPIIPLFLHHVGNPFPKGDVAIIKGMQQEINKRRAIMIHNATLAGNNKWLAEVGSIKDKEEFEKKGSMPGKVLEYRRSNNGDVPREILPQQLPSAWIQLEQEAKADLEYSVSVFAHMMGSNSDAPETYRGLLALEEAGQRKLRFKSAHAKEGIRRLGLVVLRLVQMTYTTPKMIRVIGEGSGEAQKLFMNQPRIDMLTGRIEKMNDVTVGRYDLVVEDGSSMPTNRMALLNLYMEMYQMGIIDKTEVLKKTDIVNREEVLGRMGEISQLTQQLQQMDGSMKDLEGLNQTLRRQLQQAEIHLGAQKELDKVKDAYRGTSMIEQVSQARIKDEVNLARQKMNIAAQKHELTAAAAIAQGNLEIMAAKAEAKLEAKNERISAKASSK